MVPERPFPAYLGRAKGARVFSDSLAFAREPAPSICRINRVAGPLRVFAGGMEGQHERARHRGILCTAPLPVLLAVFGRPIKMAFGALANFAALNDEAASLHREER